MKKLLTIAVAAIAMQSCSNQTSVVEQQEEGTTPVSFLVLNRATLEEQTRATLAESGCTFLYVMIDGQLTLSQKSTDSNFGTPTIDLPYGTHTVQFFSSNVEATIADGIITPSDMKDSFGYTTTINVDKNTGDQTAILSRIVNCVRFVVEDALPANIGNVSVTVTSHYTSCSSTTLLGTTSAPFTKTWDAKSEAGSKNCNFSVYSLCPSLTTQWQSTASIEFFNTEGTSLASYVIDQVPMQCNYRSVGYANMFGMHPTATVTVNNEWGEEKTFDVL